MDDESTTTEEEGVLNVLRFVVEGVAFGENTARECVCKIWHVLNDYYEARDFPLQEPDGVPDDPYWRNEVDFSEDDE